MVVSTSVEVSATQRQRRSNAHVFQQGAGDVTGIHALLAHSNVMEALQPTLSICLSRDNTNALITTVDKCQDQI